MLSLRLVREREVMEPIDSYALGCVCERERERERVCVLEKVRVIDRESGTEIVRSKIN